MVFEWDDKKAAANKAKHGVSFELAATVFDDPRALIRFNLAIDSEARHEIIGRAAGTVLVLFVIFTERGRDEDVVRIISARRAHREERKAYEG